MGAQRADDLCAIGYGKATARAVLTRLGWPGCIARAPPDGAFASVVKRVLGGTEAKIKVRGVDDLMVFRALLQSDPWREDCRLHHAGKGVSVHAATCPNVVNLLYDPERRMEVEWDRGADTSHMVRLKIAVADRKGILADISTRIAGINTNIKDVEATTDADHQGSIRMTVEIADLKHLDRVMKALKAVEGVVAVERRAAASDQTPAGRFRPARCVEARRPES